MKPGPSEISIIPVQVYRIRRKWLPIPNITRYSYSYYVGTKQQCALRMAWWCIMEKYNDIDAVDQVGMLDCDCFSDDYTYKSPGRCPIHSRYWGYFKRLADRLAVRIVATWPEAETAT